jgi:NO-binding membrane sensor protein with MHYT domain/nitrogen-specific signal transduction histidine kinase
MGATTILPGHYNPALVGLSILVAILASATSLDVAGRIRSTAGGLRAAWILGAGVAMGGGIWAMHFVGMLAFSLPVAIGYDLPITLASLALAIFVTSVAFVIVFSSRFSNAKVLVGGVFMGLGIAGMHYLGMAAVRASAVMSYQPVLVAVSIGIAICAACAALWIAGNVTGTAWRLAAAVVMGFAVTGMHYTGMAALCFTRSASPSVLGFSRFGTSSVAIAVAAGAVVILTLALVSATVDRRFAELRQHETDESRRAAARAEAALQELKATQQSLIQAEKMASLSRLTAGVAHEINTPVGTALTAATTLQRRTREFIASVEAGTITKTAALSYAAVSADGTDLIVSNILRAAELIRSFKQVAVDQTSGERREFVLDTYLQEIVHSLSPRLKQTRHVVTIDCPPGLRMLSSPGALSQIVTNLLINSIVHAYPDDRAGHLLLQVRRLRADRVELVYSDDGDGIPADHLDRIFDPFFTTSRATGGTGLGMHIVYNLVTQTLEGTIAVESVGEGTRFVIEFPMDMADAMEAFERV